MDYAAHYDRLIERARKRVLSGYVERHHVVPRCIDPASRETVRLTPEEHYTAHLLLVKMHPGSEKLAWAAMNMTGSGPTHCRRNKLYGWLRREVARQVSIRLKGVPKSANHRAALAAAKRGSRGNNTGTIWTPEMKLRQAIGHGRLPLEEMMKLPLSRLSRQNRAIVKAARLVK